MIDRSAGLSNPNLLARLDALEGGTAQRPIRVVLDTDTYNEIDDQFALAYALGAGGAIRLEAVYAAPFHNHRSDSPSDGMEKSYREIERILDLCGGAGASGAEPQLFRGSREFMKSDVRPVESGAAADLVRRAHAATASEPLYVAAIAAVTNVASAILLDPTIAETVVVVWLGGHALHWDHTREFNLIQDVAAARVLFDSGVALVQIPCYGVASHLLTTEADVRANVAPLGRVGEYLYRTYREHQADRLDLAKEIWDISTIGYLSNPEWVATHLVHSPVVTDDGTWSADLTRHLIRSAYYLRRGEIFRDMYRSIQNLT